MSNKMPLVVIMQENTGKVKSLQIIDNIFK